MKIFLCITALFLSYLGFPYVAAPVTNFVYSEKFYEKVKDDVTQLSQGKPYCIIAPRVNSSSKYHFREWVVARELALIDLNHILDHAIRGKMFLVKEGRSAKRRAEVGREMHFGLSLENEFYIWSFRSEKFIKLSFDSLTNHEKLIFNTYRALEQQERIGKISKTIDINDYYCPHLLHKTSNG